MGWSVRYAANVIEHYARVSPDETDSVLVKLAQEKGGQREQSCKRHWKPRRPRSEGRFASD